MNLVTFSSIIIATVVAAVESLPFSIIRRGHNLASKPWLYSAGNNGSNAMPCHAIATAMMMMTMLVTGVWYVFKDPLPIAEFQATVKLIGLARTAVADRYLTSLLLLLETAEILPQPSHFKLAQGIVTTAVIFGKVICH